MPDDEADELEPDDFEDIMSALLKVDPAGLSGKHRVSKDAPVEDQDSPEDSGR